MSIRDIQYAFIAGEISRRLFGRSDIEKFDLGLADSHNYFIDYRGGATNRPGSMFVDYVMDDDKDTWFLPFEFSPTVANTYVLLFGHQYIRFIQDGAYVLEADVAITGITQASPGVVTAAAHGYSTGDWVKISGVSGMVEINGDTFEVGATTTNTFELLDPFGNNFDTSALTAYTSGGTVARIYTVTSPYASTDLSELRAWQYFDYIRLTHDGYAVRNLVRSGATSWTLSEESFVNAQDVPTGVSLTPSTAGSAGVAVSITAIDRDTGIESLPSRPTITDASVNYTSTAGSLKIDWTAVDNAREYRIYRSQVLPTGSQVTAGMEMGYIGRSFAPTFVDNNIIPDFVDSPPQGNNPFANAAITHIDITAGGSGYNNTTTVTVTDANGTGFAGYPVISGGAVVSVIITNGGSGYTSPSVSFNVGTGATATATVGPATGNYPALSARWQQRQIYAATANAPLGVFGSRPGQLSNFDNSIVVVDSDPFEFELDSAEVTPIRHMIGTRGGLLLMTQKGVWQLSGGSSGNSPITPTNALADPQTYTGASDVEPLTIENDVLYIEGKGTTVRLLSYTDAVRTYSGTDVSILANHLFTETKQVVRWTYAAEPFKLAYGVRSDGGLLNFTVVKEQNVFAWTQSWTRGLYKDVISIQEGNKDSVYFMVQRYVNGRWTKFIEKQASRLLGHVEDSWFVDSALATTETYPAADLELSGTTGTITITASAAIFSAGDVDKIIRVGGGKGTVTVFNSTTSIDVELIRDVTDLIPETTSPKMVVSGDWTMDDPVSTIYGLRHLVGESVTILNDGNVEPNATVAADGSVTLSQAGTRVRIGLSYDSYIQTLPHSVQNGIIEGKLKRTIAVGVRQTESRGLAVGSSLSKMYEAKERTTELYGEPTVLQEGVRVYPITSDFNREGQIYLRQQYPLPSTILGLFFEVEVGDDND